MLRRAGTIVVMHGIPMAVLMPRCGRDEILAASECPCSSSVENGKADGDNERAFHSDDRKTNALPGWFQAARGLVEAA